MRGGAHPDVQLGACALAVEHVRARVLLRAWGLRGALSRLRRNHRRVAPWMLAVRLAMVLAEAPEG